MTDKNDDKHAAEERRAQAQRQATHPDGPSRLSETPNNPTPGPDQPQPGQQPPPPNSGPGVPNPAQPEVPTPPMPERQSAADFAGPEGAPTPYPKVLFHPVYGGVTVEDGNQEAALYPRGAWFNSAAEADMARTHTEAVLVYQRNQADKLRQLEEMNRQVVRNSAQADEALRGNQGQPL